jgi:DNA-directed RNA polymerase beta' subunit
VDFSGRTVIGPDPNLAIDEVSNVMFLFFKLVAPAHSNQLLRLLFRSKLRES